MIVVDTSALIAILHDEPEADGLFRAMADAERCLVSTVSALETAMVFAGRRREPIEWRPLEALLGDRAISLEPFDAAQVRLARDAFGRFGKGRHAAALNFGDCAVYALAMSKQLPLLFKGRDFALTDVAVVRYS